MSRWQQHILLVTERGRITVHCAGRTAIQDGLDCAWMAPACERRFGSGPGRVLHTNIRFLVLRDEQVLTPHRGLDHRSAGSDILPLAHQLVDCFLSGGPFADERTRALLVALSVACWSAPNAAGPRRRLTAAQRRRVFAYLDENIFTDPDPAALMRALDLSLDYGSRLFRNTYGMPPRRFLVQERMRRAAERLLESDLPVHRIASACGYADASFFCRQFRAVHGVSPQRYRLDHS